MDQLEQQHARRFTRSALTGVSRTFALTIPQLPEPLRQVVTTAYLLCRIADTIEDEPGLDRDAKRELHAQLRRLMEEPSAARAFATKASRHLSAATPAAERELVGRAEDVLLSCQSFDPADRESIAVCLSKMCHGMQIYEARDTLGLDDLADLDSYCYYVAGVVGEMLTELFCNHDPATARNRVHMQHLAASFGQGLQMTNILKDVWDDLPEGRCWLPRQELAQAGTSPERLREPARRAEAEPVIAQLTAIASAHLRNAMRYTLYVSRTQPGVRRFCFWSLGLAVRTLARIGANPHYRCGAEVKVSRQTLARVMVTGYLLARSNTGLSLAFRHWSRQLPDAGGPTHRDTDYGAAVAAKRA